MRCLRTSLCFILALAGCAHGPPPSAPKADPLLRLSLAPESLGRPLRLSQVLKAEVAGQDRTFRFQVEVTAERLVMVGLTHMGMPLFSLTQDAGGLRVETPAGGPFPFDPRYLLADFQLTFWPVPVLRPALGALGLRIEEKPDGLGRRVIGGDAKLLVDIAYPPHGISAGEIVLAHHDHPYRLRIVTLQEGGRS